ncbi:MAG: alpha/beta fold hydrolase [Pseudomonadota bacterium]
MQKTRRLGRSAARLVVNDLPARLINTGYNTYSRIYKGQLSLGLPVAPELLVTREQTRANAVGKLALTLFHSIYRTTGERIPRETIKKILTDELANGTIRLTEQVILLTRKELSHIVLDRLGIDPGDLERILDNALRRNILKETLETNRQPAYFESEVDERESNGRGDYETVYYRDFTDQGKEIKFRRLVSMEAVSAGDTNPSVILVPGFANNADCFNLNNTYSIAKDLADQANWVYLFEPRGVGVNAGRFDPYYTVDTLIDHDLPTVLNFITKRSCSKPSVLVGHSMGGIVAENMVLNWALRCDFARLKLPDPAKKILDAALVTENRARQLLGMVKGIISLGSPKSFNKKTHVVFPSALWLNHLSRIFRFSQVPIQEMSRVVTELPVLKDISRFIYNTNIGDLNFLICPENHREDPYFMERYLKTATESIPLGLGFQFLKSVYDGNGFKRMDRSDLNYSNHFSFFPDSIPLVHFYGSRDCLASPDNLRYSEFYPHRIKRVFHVETVEDLKSVEILPEKSQLIDIVIQGANHLDLLYGKPARDLVHPLLERIIKTLWGDWTYETPGNVENTDRTCTLMPI